MCAIAGTASPLEARLEPLAMGESLLSSRLFHPILRDMTNKKTQLCILYLLAFLDRANIGNAKIAGLSTDLRLSTSQFNATLTIFFVSYSVFEPLTNILLKKLRPSIFLPLLMCVFLFILSVLVTIWSPEVLTSRVY